MSEHVAVTVVSEVPVRLRSAARLFEEVQHLVAEWSREHTSAAPVRIAPHDSGVLEVVAPPPVVRPPFEWSTKFGHAVHDLRSSLDHLAQQLCRLEGQEPEDPKRVQFPVAESGKQWREARRGLRSMPLSLLGRIEGLQPYRSRSELSDGLLLLNQLAVKDKHYELTSLIWLPTEINLASVEAWPVGRADDVDWGSANMHLQLRPAPEGDVRGLKGLMPVSHNPILVVEEWMTPLMDVMPWLHAITRAVVETVTTGESPTLRPLAPTWASSRGNE